MDISDKSIKRKADTCIKNEIKIKASSEMKRKCRETSNGDIHNLCWQWFLFKMAQKFLKTDDGNEFTCMIQNFTSPSIYINIYISNIIFCLILQLISIIIHDHANL